MSINLTDEIEVKTKKGKLCAAKQIFLEGDMQTVEKEIQDINSRHNTLNTKHESLSKTVQGIAVTGGASTATNVTYDNDASGLNAENIQDAIDEVSSIGHFAKRGGIINISTNYNSTNTAEILTLPQALSKVPSTDRVFGFQGKYLASDGWHIIIYTGDSLISWSDTTKWIDLPDKILRSISENAVFAGIATTTTNPGTPDGPVFYFASEAGTYSNFNSISVADSEAAILEWNDGAWTKKTTGFATASKVSKLDEMLSVFSRYKKINLSELVSQGGYIDGNGMFVSNKNVNYKITTIPLKKGQSIYVNSNVGNVNPSNLFLYNIDRYDKIPYLRYNDTDESNLITTTFYTADNDIDVYFGYFASKKPLAIICDNDNSNGYNIYDTLEYFPTILNDHDLLINEIKETNTLQANFVDIAKKYKENIISSISINLEGYINKRGIYISVPSNTFRSSDFIEIDDNIKNRKMYIKTKGNVAIAPICFYDNEQNFITYFGENGSEFAEFEFNIPLNAKYYRLSFTTKYNVSSNPYEFGIIKSELKDNYTKEEINSLINSIINNINNIKGGIKLIDIGKNAEHGYIKIDGSYTANEQWRTSQFVDIDGDFICYTNTNNQLIGTPYFYDDNDSYLGYQIITDGGFLGIKINPPTNAKKMRFSWQIGGSEVYLYKISNIEIYGADVLIIPIFGQSNALGWHATPAISVENKYKNVCDKDLLALSENTIAAAKWGVCETSASGTGNFIINKIKTENTIVIPVSGIGGNPITQFIKGSNGYNTVINNVSRAYQFYKAKGLKVKVLAYCYIQGESEVETSVDYKGLLSQMQIDFSNDIKAMTGQIEDVPCCVFNLSWIGNPKQVDFASNNMRVCTAQMELVRDNENFIASSPTYCCGYNPNDQIHLSNIGEYLLGQYQGIALSKLINGEKHKGVYPKSIEVQGNNIIINVNVPTKPLKVNTTLLSNVSNKGFSVINSSDIDIIVDVSITDNQNGIITITCNENPVGSKLRYGCNGTTEGSYTDGPRGNISDSNGLIDVANILGKLYPLDNYMQFFEYIIS